MLQKLVYYVRHILHDAETKYAKLEKVVYALVILVRSLFLYFQAHIATLLNNKPIRSILHLPKTLGWLAK